MSNEIGDMKKIIVIWTAIITVIWIILSHYLLVDWACYADTMNAAVSAPAWLTICGNIVCFPMEFLGPWEKSFEGFARADIFWVGFLAIAINGLLWGLFLSMAITVSARLLMKKRPK